MKKRVIACFVIALLAQGYLFGSSLRVESLTINTTGTTKPSAIDYFVDIDKGDEFETQEELDAALRRDVQDLINLQVFESVSSEITPSPSVPGGVDITFHVVDSWNLFPVPVFKFDSNVGWKAGAKLKYPNAFGSLMNLEANANIEQRDNDWSKAQLYGDLALSRIRLFDSYSSVKFISKYNMGSKTFSLDLDSNIGFYLRDHAYTGHINLGYNNKVYRTDFGLSSNFYFMDRTLRYTPKVLFEFAHNGRFFSGAKNLLITQTLQSGSINWRGYFRTGYTIRFTNNTRFYMDSAHTGDRVWSDFTTQFTKFHLLEDSNIKWRLTGYGRTSGSHNSLGSYVRGVLNGSLKGDLGIFANFDWVFRVATWDGEGVVDWVGGGEFHLAPFIDMGIAHHFDTGWSPLEVTAGAEGVFFFNEARSIKLSGLLGLSLNDTVQKFKGTLDGGIEKEIIVNFSIYY